MSRFKARRGVIYRTLIPGGRSAVVSSMLRTGKKAASVLPVAVGEINNRFLPSRILGMVFSWGSVGAENPRCSIKRRIGLTNRSNTEGFRVSTVSIDYSHILWNQVHDTREAFTKRILETASSGKLIFDAVVFSVALG